MAETSQSLKSLMPFYNASNEALFDNAKYFFETDTFPNRFQITVVRTLKE